MHQIMAAWHAESQHYKDDLKKLIAIRSVRAASAGDEAPFGLEIREAFDVFLASARRFGLSATDMDGYILEITYDCQRSENIGITGHLDIVPEGDWEEWETDPFALTEADGYLLGRGVTDDKGPILGMLYLLGIMKRLGIRLPYNVLLLVGGDEESHSRCMKHYLSQKAAPRFSFCCDCDFPIVHCEKGILKGELQWQAASSEAPLAGAAIQKITSEKQYLYGCWNLTVHLAPHAYLTRQGKFANASEIEAGAGALTIRYRTKPELSRHPERGTHALDLFIEDLKRAGPLRGDDQRLYDWLQQYWYQDPYAQSLSLAFTGSGRERTTRSVCWLGYEGGRLSLGLDFRSLQPKEKLDEQWTQWIAQNQAVWTVHDRQELLYLDPADPLIQKPLQIYNALTGSQAAPLTKGGASYARTLPRSFGFGPTFPGEKPFVHEPNERISWDSLTLCVAIYATVLVSLE